jgi:glycerol-3-phosphate O-acyltransferase
MRLLVSAFVLAGVACAIHEYIGDVKKVSPQMSLASVLFASNPALARNTGRRATSAGLADARVAPKMIIEQMKKAADDLKGAAAETVIQQKVSDKLAKAKEKYTIPEKYEGVMADLFTSYMTEVYKAGKDTDKYEGLLTQLFKKVLEQFKNPYNFEPYHKAIREPFDYYSLGNDFVSAMINADDSVVLGEENLAEMQELLKKGENVVLLANHQSEADPQIYSALLDPRQPGFAESTIFVAGDRVTTDLFAQPFSMGRNLLCIFSKKHIENPPELKAEKSKHNRQVMVEMKKLFGEGGKIIWVAPSGGRDRKNPDTGKYKVADFDPKAVEMFRLMGDKAKKKTHFYPFSMLTYTISPAPDSVGGDVGEFRAAKYAPAGLNFGKEIDIEAFAEGCVTENFPEGCEPLEAREVLREALSKHVHDIVEKNYESLEVALKV